MPNAATSPAADDFILLSGTANGARKISRSDFIAAIASQIVAAPSTYKIATLDGADKLTSSQDPSQSVSYLGGHDMVANSPALADGSGTAGDTYYVTNPGTRNYGSGNITAQEGDALVYSGSVWQLVEGIANILDGISTASTARTTLEVNSIDEDAEATGTKLVGPSLYFDGSNDYVEVADDDRLSFTDGANDVGFSISFWLKTDDVTGCYAVSKYNAAPEYGVFINASDKLRLRIRGSGSNYWDVDSVAALTDYEGKWVHIAATYGGSGPSAASGVDFSAADSQVALYVNGAAVETTSAETGTYAGMVNGADPLWLGRLSGSYAKGHIREVKIFNRSLSATEIAQLARGNDLGFSEEWGGALGGVYTSDFSVDEDGWTATRATVTGNVDSIGGQDDNVSLSVDATAETSHYLRKNAIGTSAGKRYRVDLDYYIPSANTNANSFRLHDGAVYLAEVTATLDAWTHYSVEYIDTDGELRIFASKGGDVTFTGSGDLLYFRNIKVTEVGTLADFRAERYDTSTNKLYDLSDNAFVGTGTSVTLTGREVPVYEHGTWTPTITFGGGSTGVTYGTQEGYYTRVGNTAHVTCVIALTSKGSDTGSAVVEGLPFTSRNTSGSAQTIGPVLATTMASLGSVPCAVAGDATSNAQLFDSSASGFSFLDDTNFNNTSAIRFSGTYQIQ